MKRLIPMLLLSTSYISAQTVVVNDKLLTQLTKNQTVRLASNQQFFNSYEKQKKLYDEANNKLTQIVAIQDHIYRQLVNINSGLRQGKKLYYLSQYFVKIAGNANDVLQLSIQRPEYAILLGRYYRGATEELLGMQKELMQIMTEEHDFLMDPFDRDVVINNLYRRARLLNGNFIAIKIRLQQAKQIPYLYQVPMIKTYINLDKMIIKDIIRKYNFIFK